MNIQKSSSFHLFDTYRTVVNRLLTTIDQIQEDLTTFGELKYRTLSLNHLSRYFEPELTCYQLVISWQDINCVDTEHNYTKYRHYVVWVASYQSVGSHDLEGRIWKEPYVFFKLKKILILNSRIQ